MECSGERPASFSHPDLLGLLDSPVRVRFPTWGIKRLVKSEPSKYQLFLFYLNTQRVNVSQNELFNC